MRPQSQEDLIESLEDIVEEMRAILVQEGDDHAILRAARIALSDWFIAQHPHLDRSRPQLRVIQGDGEGTGRLF
jgi:hypothetical protein